MFSYAVATAEELSGDLELADRNMLPHIHRYISRLQIRGDKLQELDAWLWRIRNGAAEDRSSALTELVSMCGQGLVDFPLYFMFDGAAAKVLHTAYEMGMVDALVAAVHPKNRWRGRLGRTDTFRGPMRKLAFNLLGQLAARFDSTDRHEASVGTEAVEALVGLVAHAESAGSAISRIPVRAIDRRRFDQLKLDMASYEELLADDPFFVEESELTRVPAMISDLLWAASDAKRFT